MSGLVNEINKRNLKACHVLCASMLGDLAERGFLNQGVLNIMIPKVADKLIIFLKQKYGEDSTSDINTLIKNTVDRIISELDAFISYKMDINGSKVTLIIDGSTCKFCPKGVGGAQLPGILCLFPQLFREVLSKVTKRNFRYALPDKLVKKAHYCIMQFEITE